MMVHAMLQPTRPSSIPWPHRPQGVNTTMFNPDLALKPMDLSQGTLVFGTQYTGTARPFRFLSVFKVRGARVLLSAQC